MTDIIERLERQYAALDPVDEYRADARDAIEEIMSLRGALRSQQEPVLWQYRWLDTNPHTVTSGQWSCWEEVKPRNPYTNTVLDKVNEVKGYIARGFKYELRRLYTDPQPAIPDGWKLVPVEPTKEMWAAVNKLDDEMASGSYDGRGCSIEQAWNCLLAAAPEPSK